MSKTIYSTVYRTRHVPKKEQPKFKPLKSKLFKPPVRPGAMDYKNIASVDTGASIVADSKPVYEGEMAEREAAAQKEIDYKKTCVAPLHKSNYVYVTEGMNPAGFGRKNEVL